jgi:predicted CoA-binding protein
MTRLYQALQSVRSEEDVKDIYIKALGLKKVTKGLIDIQADEIWFEAKDTGRHSCYAMFTQLLHTCSRR